jgi:lipoteichoic acid synthase
LEIVAIRSGAPRKVVVPAVLIESALWLAYIVSMLLKCSYFQFSTKLNVRPWFNSLNMNMLLSSFTTILLPLALIIVIFNRKRLTALFIINILMTALLFADTMYFRYYYNAITIPVLYQIGLVGSIGESMKSLFKWQDIVFIADLPFIAAGLVALAKKRGRQGGGIPVLKRLIAAVVVFGLCFGLFQIAWSKSSTYMFPYDNNYVVNNLGIFYFHYYDVKNYLHDNLFIDKTLTKTDKSTVNAYFDAKKPEGIKYKDAAKGKNLIVIQMEAMQQFLINKKFNGKEVTPNMNKFINDSAYFDNFYYQTGGGNTADAEFLTNTSLYPLKDGAVYFRFPSNTYEATPNLLKEQGYETYVFHANNPSFWNRTEMYKSLGFDHFISSSDYVHDEFLGWGLGDKSFLRQSLDKIDTSKPFYGFFITLSSHHPFDYFKNYQGFNVGKYDSTFLGNYMKAANYVDQAIGQLLDDLKRRGLYENTVIVIYGDHNAFLKDQVNMLTGLFDYKDSNFNWVNLQKTPCFIRFPGMDNKGLQKTIGGELDILPTVANLLGFEAPHAMGKDLFNTEKGYAVLRNSTVITDQFEYLNSDGNVYDSTGAVLPKGADDAVIKAYQQQLAVSDIILKKNALNHGIN